ncbi:DUF937 domain-containing protein [Bradyrhizobium sp. CCGUVB1N3]|uniref:DUF937 domain-containing protein n=1 Tax=Bradyrhizobium sp. CCGUVB1N3 TaxID=2949629 RepID=UPI0020B3549B|nr:DUF937 domain-containing protein [Bradyrhizobium sp. CCGUVB1N3]MCP3471301.1 DUF937 domain-containing protein [Bradyrhizobium sp. CCGUVB1N3]
MAANLTSVVMQFLTPEVLSQIASFLGIDRTTAQKATTGAVPSLLAGLADLVGTPAGSNQLSKLLSQQQTGSLADILRSAGPDRLAESGSGMLSELFGAGTMGTMAQAVGKFAGLGDGGGKSLLSILGPIVLGALGQHQREAGLDANGLASLLRSQKDQISAAIPAGLANQLSAAGLIDQAGAGVRSGMAAASAAGSRVASATERASSAYATATKTTQWPYWLAALVVLGGLAWYAFDRPGQQTVAEQTAPARPTTATVGMAPPNLTVDGVNLASQVNTTIDSLKSALPSITDATGAQAALPKINAAISQLDDVGTRAAKLTPEGRTALAKLIAAAMPAINQMCDKVMAAPGVGPIAKPAIDDLKAKLDSLARV